MGDGLVIVPSDGDGYTELARTRSGRLFKKHLLNKGQLRHPGNGEVITIDDAFVSKLKQNFEDRICDIVQVPLANAKNEHSEEPDRNIGEVVDIQVDGDKVYAVLDIRDAAHADRMGKTYLGASAMMSLDYTDTKTGKKVGPTLLHSCVTNRPYVTGLDDYEEIVAATSDSSDEAAVLLSEKTVVAVQPAEETETVPEQETTQTVAEPSLDEMLAALKAKHNIDVSALQATQADAAKQTALSQTIVDALAQAGVVKLTATDEDKPSTETVITAVQELATNNVSLSGRVQAMEKREAEHVVDGFISQGRILPAEREARVELKLSNPAMFDKLLPANPIVKLSHEDGITPADDKKQETDVDAEIARLSALIA
jgi:hypothetical protein